ncbi:rhomboid-like protein [Streptomyces sp. NPDC051322]|uniref:rhomboid-like protein n=1 Tax=Streptomyces sp. NPDC051322 TaxID=3154645 RepID=UPI00344D38DE
MTRALHAVRSYIRSAPGTYLWLAVLLGTTIALHQMPPGHERAFLGSRSTNIHELSVHPVRVLIQSALWIGSGHWVPYAVLFTVFHAQAERWIGTARWLAVAASAHVFASFISEGALLWAIQLGHAPKSAVNTLDVGVSYALAGVIGVLTYRIITPWRYGYLAVILLSTALPLVTARTFTDLGHFTSVLIGLAWYPVTRGRPRINPVRALHAARRYAPGNRRRDTERSGSRSQRSV